MGDVQANYIVVKNCNVISFNSALNLSRVIKFFAFFCFRAGRMSSE